MAAETLPNITLYSDGACDPNPGPGGWAAILLFGKHRWTLKGGDPDTTNNRMELQAVIAALNDLKKPCHVQLHTDSEYLRKGVTIYLARWKTEGWRTTVKQPVANQDLWQALDRAAQPHLIEWHWVKGHAGSALNEEVDRLAVSMIPRAALPLAEAGAFHVFTAASCQGVSGPGAWAAVIRHGDSVRELSGREEKTSSNRLHLLAAVKGLVAVPEEATIHLYTASDYAAQGAEQWVKGWVKQDWRTKDGQPVKHRGLWQAIVDGSAKRRVRWHSLKAGVRPPEAQRAEALAKKRVG